MKNYFIFFLLTFLLMSCDRSEIPGDVITHEFERIKLILPRSSWEIVKYVDEGTDRTNLFTDYTFDFTENDSILVRNDDSLNYGRWMYESQPGDDEKLVLHLPEPIAYLSDSWKILSIINAEVKLSRSETDTLFFKRIEEP